VRKLLIGRAKTVHLSSFHDPDKDPSSEQVIRTPHQDLKNLFYYGNWAAADLGSDLPYKKKINFSPKN